VLIGMAPPYSSLERKIMNFKILPLVIIALTFFTVNAFSQSIPSYQVVKFFNDPSGKKWGDVVIPSFSKKTPKTEREKLFKIIVEKEGFNYSVSFYQSEAARNADYSKSFADAHPDAKKLGCLGSWKHGKIDFYD
jgi:hypothetical protein